MPVTGIPGLHVGIVPAPGEIMHMHGCPALPKPVSADSRCRIPCISRAPAAAHRARKPGRWWILPIAGSPDPLAI